MSDKVCRIDATVSAEVKKQLKAKLALQGKTLTTWVQEKVLEEIQKQQPVQ